MLLAKSRLVFGKAVASGKSKSGEENILPGMDCRKDSGIHFSAHPYQAILILFADPLQDFQSAVLKSSITITSRRDTRQNL